MVVSVSCEFWKLAFTRLLGSRNHPGAPRRGLRSVAAGRIRDQAARIHGVNCNVRADSRVGGRFNLRLIFDSGFSHATREINESAFSLPGMRREFFDASSWRAQFAIGVKDIELCVVGGKASAVVAFIGAGRREIGEIGSLRRRSVS